MNRRVVICGGTGFLGRALQASLTKEGYEVVIVSRHPKGDEKGWQNLAEVMEGALAVVNLSGRSIACKFSEENKREIVCSRVESSRSVADAIRGCQQPPKKWINAAATGLYGDCGEAVATIDTPPGSGFVPDVCRAWEAECRNVELPVQKVVLRIGIVMAEHGGMLQQLIPLAKRFMGGAAGSGRQWMAWISLGDLIRLIRWTIEHDCPEVINACSPKPIRNGDLMAWLRREVGRPWTPPIPAFMIRIVGKIFGPDASLPLTSCRAVFSPELPFEFRHIDLEQTQLSDLAN